MTGFATKTSDVDMCLMLSEKEVCLNHLYVCDNVVCAKIDLEGCIVVVFVYLSLNQEGARGLCHKVLTALHLNGCCVWVFKKKYFSCVKLEQKQI